MLDVVAVMIFTGVVILVATLLVAAGRTPPKP